jgi:dipeptidyl aminopeptidase/acylaminoacyl peptidase
MPSSLPPTSISTASHGIRDFLYWGDKDTSGNPLELYVVRDGKTEAQKVATAPIFLLEPKIWISPDGRHAITLAPAVNAPASWEAYRVWDKAAQGWTADRRSSDPTSELLYDRLRYQLVDLVKMEARPLFDAPEATLAFNRAPHFVAWLPGGTEVIISHSYLPLGAVSSEERQRRVSAPAIAQVNVLTGKARAIAWEPLVTAAEQKEGRQADRIVDVAWDAGARELRIDTEPPGKLKASTYYALDRHWEARRPSVSNAALALKVELEQNIHAPPILVASGGACHCRRMIYDPAPELAKLSLGRAEEFSWIDEKGRPWKGALLYPVGYRQGKRYPLVIQPHGYSPQEFLFDGPGGVTSAFAGQPLANAGIMVLQAGEIAEAITDDRNEGIEVANAWAAAIRELDRRGLIDIGRVGIIGWSRTGYHVAAMMALHPNLVRAATISDAIQYNYTQQMFAAADPLSEEGIKRVTGRSPVETGYGRWFDSNVFYGLSRSPAALRVEAYGLGSLISLWETYAISKQSGHTAELIYFPKGGHILQKPSERLSSQQGNVDWFEKWLLKSASGIK